MNKTSSAVKRKYNAKTYKDWRAPIKFELFDQIEVEREKLGMSRAQYLEHLLTNQTTKTEGEENDKSF